MRAPDREQVTVEEPQEQSRTKGRSVASWPSGSEVRNCCLRRVAIRLHRTFRYCAKYRKELFMPTKKPRQVHASEPLQPKTGKTDAQELANDDLEAVSGGLSFTLGSTLTSGDIGTCITQIAF